MCCLYIGDRRTSTCSWQLTGRAFVFSVSLLRRSQRARAENLICRLPVLGALLHSLLKIMQVVCLALQLVFLLQLQLMVTVTLFFALSLFLRQELLLQFISFAFNSSLSFYCQFSAVTLKEKECLFPLPSKLLKWFPELQLFFVYL